MALWLRSQPTAFFKISIFKYQSLMFDKMLSNLHLFICGESKFLWSSTWFKREANIRFIMELSSSQMCLYWVALRRGLSERMKGLVHAYDLLSPSYNLSKWLQKLKMLYPLKPRGVSQLKALLSSFSLLFYLILSLHLVHQSFPCFTFSQSFVHLLTSSLLLY